MMRHNATDDVISPLMISVITPLMMYYKTTDGMRDDATDDV
jgi:hypothetical protein